LATAAINESINNGKLPLIVGGAGLYIEALTAGLFNGPEIDPAVRRNLHEKAAKIGSLELHRQLQNVDPDSASAISHNDLIRIIRALEIYESSGRTMSEWRRNGEYSPVNLDYLWLGLTWPRRELYRRINQRVDQMISDGLLAEIDALLRDGLGLPIINKGIVGYYEIINAIENKSSVDMAIDLVKQHSRNYAKRQMTWFNNRGNP
jgi:tRNA dimethylallyltransferase